MMNQLGSKQLCLSLHSPLTALPEALQSPALTLSEEGYQLIYSYDIQQKENGIPELLQQLSEHNITFHDLNSSESSLEDIFVDLVKEEA